VFWELFQELLKTLPLPKGTSQSSSLVLPTFDENHVNSTLACLEALFSSAFSKDNKDHSSKKQKRSMIETGRGMAAVAYLVSFCLDIAKRRPRHLAVQCLHTLHSLCRFLSSSLDGDSSVPTIKSTLACFLPGISCESCAILLGDFKVYTTLFLLCRDFLELFSETLYITCVVSVVSVLSVVWCGMVWCGVVCVCVCSVV